jgi:signal transduction histidine kinase/DNA-binding response OmpR family regulator
MGKILNLFFVSLVLLVNFGLTAQKVHEIDTLYPVHSLDYVLRVYPDSSEALSPEKVLNDSTSEFLKGGELPRMLEVGVIYWGKVKLMAKQPLEGWTLHFEDKMIGPPAWTKSNGKVDVFVYSDGQLISHQKTGVEYLERDREYKGHWALNAISLEGMPVNTTLTLVMRVQGNAMGYPAYFNLSARSPEQPFYHQFNQYHNSFNLFLFGVTFIILVYHILQYIYLRESIYLWFCLWLLFCTLGQSMTVGLIVGSLFTLKYTIWFLIANGQFYSFWFFGRAFVDSKNKFPKMDKMMMGLALFILIEIVLMAYYVVLAKPQTYMTGVSFHYNILNIYALISLVVSILLAFKKDLFARYFGIGAIVASLSLVIGTLWSLGLMRPPLGIDPYATGIFLQIVMYSFGIAYRRQTLAKKAEHEKIEAERSQAEMLRMKDLDELKTRFFTNISHEFRTPLTLIQGPINQAKKFNDNAENISLSQKDFEIVKRNSNRLQSLVDELLELSKLESGKTTLTLVRGDIIPLIKAVTYSFESMAERSGITLQTSFPTAETEAFFDKEKLEKIIYNLLSNAFKYTPAGGIVNVQLYIFQEELQLSVSDTGKGISKEDLPYVFDRFYRVEGSEKKGSGIGLALVKELTEHHNGSITVTSSPGTGSTFRLKLPIVLDKLPKSARLAPGSTAIKVDPKSPQDISTMGDHVEPSKKSDLPLALVVEDNRDLRAYINGIIKDQYEVLLAEEGEEGVALALEHIPDIILTDVMMPKKDGFELCEAVKKDSKTSHIPIIMLTAKAGQENKMQGLQEGADAYLTKPFDVDELLVRMKNLISVRERLWEKLKKTEGILIDDLELNSVDDQFLQKVFKTIDEHLDDTLFTVESLSGSVGFSRAQLHRKLKALLNKSPNQLISEVRLNMARKMLQNRTGNVSEVAYSVGFSNLSYFSKSFKQKFGIAPSEVQAIKSQ